MSTTEPAPEASDIRTPSSESTLDPDDRTEAYVTWTGDEYEAFRRQIVAGVLEVVDHKSRNEIRNVVDEAKAAATSARSGSDASQGGPRSSQDSTRDELVRTTVQLAALAGTCGVVTYGALRGAYALFYSRYRVAPEELGFTQIDVLSRSATALFLAAVPAILAVTVWLEGGKKSRDGAKAGVLAGAGLCLGTLAAVFMLRGVVLREPPRWVSGVTVVVCVGLAIVAALVALDESDSRRRLLLVVAAALFPCVWIGWLYGTSFAHQPGPYAPPSEIVNPNVFVRTVCFNEISTPQAECVNGLLLNQTDRDFIIYSEYPGCLEREACVRVLPRTQATIRSVAAGSD